MSLYSRTDLAAEALEGLGSVSVPGLVCEDAVEDSVSFSRIRVTSDGAAEALGKPRGTYCTVKLDSLLRRDSLRFPAYASVLARLMRGLLPKDAKRFLCVGLGNPDITPDALGSLACEFVIPTRHLPPSELFAGFSEVSVLRTGVAGTTGVESRDHIISLAALIKPDAVILVDAFAGSDAARLCLSVQVADTGISPGSGVGNDRGRIDSSLLRVPVISVGVPTVVDASALSDESPHAGMFVTPRTIDYDVRTSARLIGYAIDLALHPGLTVTDVDALVG